MQARCLELLGRWLILCWCRTKMGRAQSRAVGLPKYSIGTHALRAECQVSASLSEVSCCRHPVLGEPYWQHAEGTCGHQAMQHENAWPDLRMSRLQAVWAEFVCTMLFVYLTTGSVVFGCRCVRAGSHPCGYDTNLSRAVLLASHHRIACSVTDVGSSNSGSSGGQTGAQQMDALHARAWRQTLLFVCHGADTACSDAGGLLPEHHARAGNRDVFRHLHLCAGVRCSALQWCVCRAPASAGCCKALYGNMLAEDVTTLPALQVATSPLQSPWHSH